MFEHPCLRSGIDRGIQSLARVAMRGWFRSVEIEGTDRLPPDRPVLVVASHLNGFVDPALLVAFAPRMPRFLAKATLWKVPPARVGLEFAGVLPVHRSDDGTTAGNVQTFAATHEVLRHGGVIGIFPEGTTHDEPTLKRIHTGAARIALGARAAGARGVLVVPVGLVYEDKAAPRSRALVRVGPAIDLDAELGRFVLPGEQASDANHDAVERLTDAIGDALRAAAVDYPDKLESAVLATAAAVRLRPPDLDPVATLPMGQVEPVMRRLAHAPDDLRHHVIAETALYRTQLDVMKLRDADVAASPDALSKRGRVAPRVAKIAALSPLAAAGTVIDGPTYLAVQRLSDRPMARVSRANFTLLASLAAYPVTWLAWGLGARFGLKLKRGVLGMFLLGPVSGHAAVVVAEQGQKLVRRRTGYRQVLRNARDLDPVLAQRARVIAAIDAALAASPPA